MNRTSLTRAALAFAVAFSTAMLSVLTDVMADGGALVDVAPIAIVVAALGAFVAVGNDRVSLRQQPPPSQRPQAHK